MTQPSPETQRYDVLVSLEQGDNSKPLSAGKLVQRRHYETLRRQIQDHIDGLAELGEFGEFSKQSDYPLGDGWAQFLDGSRGAGKSTFLSSIKEILESDAGVRGKMAFIALIDPSRIEHSEIILLVILQRLRKQVDEAFGHMRQIKDEPLRNEWRQAFKGVAGGLSLFAKDHHPLDDLDPELFLDWGLERAGDSTGLRRKLHHLFDTACRILGVKALMLGFDDADTDSTHAINLLECIRKYLDTPRMMVLVTGDLELYSLLVRQHFLRTVAGGREAAFHRQQGSARADQPAQYPRMLDHLEEQYLLKLFPIRRRRQLQPLWNVADSDDCKGTHSNWGGSEFDIKDIVRAMVQRGLRCKTRSDVDRYTEFLLKQPLRATLQVMAHCAPYLVKATADKLEYSAGSIELTNALSRSLQALALTSLYKFSVDTEAIAAKELQALTQAIFDLSLRDGDIDTAPYLRPMSAESDIRTCFAALAAEVPNFCTGHPGTALRYLLSGPGSVSIYSLAQGHFNSEDSLPPPEFVRKFKSYMGVGRREDGADWARRATAVIAQPYSSNYKHRVVLPGVVGLRGKARTGEKKAAQSIREAVGDTGIPQLPVFALSMVKVTGATNSRTYASIFVLIGLIEKLLSADPYSAGVLFERAYPSMTVSAPDWSGRSDTDTKNEDEAEDDTDDEKHGKLGSDTMKQHKLWIQVNEWHVHARKLFDDISPSSVFLGKVWTRLFFSLQNAAEDLKSKADFATVMEIFALCVINAFLVEEAEHHLLASTEAPASLPVERSNPRTSVVRFKEKLLAAQPKRKDFPFTAIMATCPLLLGLLGVENGYDTALQSLFPPDTDPTSITGLLRPERLARLMEKTSISGESRGRPLRRPKPKVKQADDEESAAQ